MIRSSLDAAMFEQVAQWWRATEAGWMVRRLTALEAFDAFAEITHLLKAGRLE